VSYNGPEQGIPCPYCGSPCDCDVADVGVGFVQCGPYHCLDCGASQIGPYDKERPLSEQEKKTGWYAPGSEPGSSANVIAGQIVSHQEARNIYRALYPFSATETGQAFIRGTTHEFEKIHGHGSVAAHQFSNPVLAQEQDDEALG